MLRRLVPLLLCPLLAHADVLRYSTTPNGFQSPPRGWNSFALQSVLNQENVLKQCDAMRAELGEFGFEYCSLDDGWSLSSAGDDNGRITYEPSLFDLPTLATHLHDNGAKLGINILPGFYANDADKTILGTDIKLSSIQADGENACGDLERCNINYDAPGAQEWCDSNVQQFADWGVDLLKLDKVTAAASGNNSGSVACYHKAIENSGRQIRLDITWRQERNDTFDDIWKTNADSMRTDAQPATTSSTNTTTTWPTILHSISAYRTYILAQLSSADPLTIYPDLSAPLPLSASPLTDSQRRATLSHHLAAGSSLVLSSDITALDTTSRTLLTNPAAYAVANFSAVHPMVPTEGNAESDGEGPARQIWIAGPDGRTGEAVVVLAWYGASNTTTSDESPVFDISPKDLGLAAAGTYTVEDVWAGGEAKRLEYETKATWNLDAGGDAALLRFRPEVTAGGEGRVRRGAVPAEMVEREESEAAVASGAGGQVRGWGVGLGVACLGMQVLFLML